MPDLTDSADVRMVVADAMHAWNQGMLEDLTKDELKTATAALTLALYRVMKALYG